MNKIIVYEHYNFKGLSKEFTADVPDLNQVQFNDCISSVKVFGNPWVAYTSIQFKGTPTVYEEGEYPHVYYNDNISSLELVSEDLDDPQITLYEHENYQGQSLVLNGEANLLHGTFNDTTSSHKVQKGAWILYQHRDKGGYLQVARAGQDVPKYTWFDNHLTHACPMKAGNVSIQAEIEWDKKTESVKLSNIDSFTNENFGSERQTCNIDLNQEFSSSVTESFRFSNATEISYGSKFAFSVPGLTGERNLNVSNTFTVEKGSSNTRTTTGSIKLTLPTSIPPRTKLTVNIVRKEVTVKVPVKLTSTSGKHTKVEYGDYVEDGKSFTTQFKEEKI